MLHFLVLLLQSSETNVTYFSVAVIGAIWTMLMFYIWLCVVSHYQILGEVQSMGSDKVKVLQEVSDENLIDLSNLND